MIHLCITGDIQTVEKDIKKILIDSFKKTDEDFLKEATKMFEFCYVYVLIRGKTNKIKLKNKQCQLPKKKTATKGKRGVGHPLDVETPQGQDVNDFLLHDCLLF
jgi:hypothetical protein